MVKKATLSTTLKKKTASYLALLRKNGIKVDKTLIFGSHAKGKPKSYSDIDICIVSKQFGKDIFEEQVRLAEIAHQVDVRFEPHAYHPLDLKEKYDPLAEEIRKHGILVKEK